MKNNLRYEKKWIFKNYNLNFIINLLHKSNFNFVKQFENRKINSIYFDDNNLTSIKDNLEGHRNRLKIRLRWYGKSNIIRKPVLEYKLKKGLISKKNRIKIDIDEFSLERDKDLELLNKIIKRKILNNNISAKILINYERNYFFSSNRLIRSTIDKDIKFKKFNNFFPVFYSNINKLVLELKYGTNSDNQVRKLINNFPVRYAKSSKYVMCMLENAREFRLYD